MQSRHVAVPERRSWRVVALEPLTDAKLRHWLGERFPEVQVLERPLAEGGAWWRRLASLELPAEVDWVLVTRGQRPRGGLVLLEQVLRYADVCEDEIAVVPLVGGRPEPGYAAYRRRALELLREAMRATDGTEDLRSLLAGASHRIFWVPQIVG